MLPFNCLNNTIYPLSADIYYAVTTQDGFGKVDRAWYFNRTISCSVLSQNVNRDPELTPDQLMKYKDDLSLRTAENIRSYFIYSLINFKKCYVFAASYVD